MTLSDSGARCRMTYKFPGSDNTCDAFCININSAMIMFCSESDVEPGKALEICIMPENDIVPPMTAFIEVICSNPIGQAEYEISASIQGIKAN